MLTHQERVVEEKRLLDEKLDKLREFVKGSVFKTIDEVEQTRLMRQEVIMGMYSGVLAERIVAF